MNTWKSTPIVALSFLCGCAGPALHHTFSDYSEAYASCMNDQLLLNLARASCNEPPYFVQLGQMNAQFTFKSGLSFTSTRTRNSAAGPIANVGGLAKEVLTYGGSVTAEMTETPIFNFVPLNGEHFAAAINNPIPEKLFLTLYSQGFHADILARTLVTAVRGADGKYLVNHPRDATYPEFLQFCRQLREWQLSHKLIVTNTPAFEPTVYRDVKLSDTIAGIAAGITVRNTTDNTNFVVTTSHENFRLQFVAKPMTNEFSSVKAINQPGGFGNVFQMRTFLSTLYAVAREEAYFRENARSSEVHGLKYRTNELGYIVGMNGTDVTRPILTLTGHDASGSSLTKWIAVKHNGKTYAIADPKDEIEQPNHRVFSLLSLLFVEVTIDPQKLPVQQLIQVR